MSHFPASNGEDEAHENENEGVVASATNGMQRRKRKCKRTIQETRKVFFSNRDMVLIFHWATEMIRDESSLSFYNDRPALKMLLRDIQVTLRMMIVFHDAYPTSDEFATTFEAKFNDQAGSYVDHQRKQTNLSLCI